jgi:Xaa-Pro dipeptidase
MKDLMSADFPYEEYTARYAHTQEVLRRQTIDALFLTGRQNLRYFAGLRDGAWDAHHFYFLVVLPAEGEPVLLVSNGFQHLVKQCWIEDVRFWPLSSAFYMSKESHAVSLVLDVLREKGLERGTIGMELSSDLQPNMAHDHFSAIIGGLPHAHIVDGSEAVWALRCIKSPAEIGRLRQAADISATGVKAAFEQLLPGMTEKAVVDIMTSVMCAEGASELRFNAIYAGPRAMWADGMPTDYVLQPGDLVQFDGGCIYEGYWCDFKRMAAVGEPRQDQRRFYELAREGLEAAIEVIRPGVPCSEPLRAAFAINDKAGFGSFSQWCLEAGWSAIGHSLGLDIHEHPGLGATNTALLQENMVLSVEPFITLDGVYPFWEASEKFGLEDVVLVTGDGTEVLTSEEKVTHDLWVV